MLRQPQACRALLLAACGTARFAFLLPATDNCRRLRPSRLFLYSWCVRTPSRLALAGPLPLAFAVDVRVRSSFPFPY